MKISRSILFALLVGLGLAAILFAVVRWVPFGEYPGDPFFDLAAQTIPILLVALAVEAQVRQFDLERAGKRIRIAAVIFLALGQTTAIVVSAALYIPESGTFMSDLLVVVTAVGLLGGFFAVIVVALRSPTNTALERAMRETAPESHAPAAIQHTTRLPSPARPLLFTFLGMFLSAILLQAARRDAPGS